MIVVVLLDEEVEGRLGLGRHLDGPGAQGADRAEQERHEHQGEDDAQRQHARQHHHQRPARRRHGAVDVGALHADQRRAHVLALDGRDRRLDHQQIAAAEQAFAGCERQRGLGRGETLGKGVGLTQVSRVHARSGSSSANVRNSKRNSAWDGTTFSAVPPLREFTRT
jgi:hypothetical protein